MTVQDGKWHVKLWTRTQLPVSEVRRRAMQYFGGQATPDMALVLREPERLLFSDPAGDLAVRVDAGRPNTVAVITSHWPAQAQEFLKRWAEAEGGVIHYEAESERPAGEILQRAREYFGQGGEGLGLALSAEHLHSLEFSGGGGQVTVAVLADGRPMVHVAAREWEYHAEQFLREMASEH